MSKQSTIYNPEELRHLREHLKTLMEEHNLPPARLAAKSIVPLSTLTRILNGQVSNPGIDTVTSIAKGLGVSMSELLGDAANTSEEDTEYFTLTVEGKNRRGMLRDITNLITNESGDITRCFATVGNRGRARIFIGLPMTSPDWLEYIVEQIQQIKGVETVKPDKTPRSATTVTKDAITEAETFLDQQRSPQNGHTKKT